MTARISLSRIHFPVHTLGPGRRLGIWFQGCSLHCAGCVSADTWRFRDSQTTVDDVLGQIAPWLAECDGVTISGGEPFEQEEALHELLRAIGQSWQVNVLVYSGFPWERIERSPLLMEGLVDALISDPYIHSESQSKPLRGSDNQRLHPLTPRGRAVFAGYDDPDAINAKKLDVMFDADGSAWLAGIPARGDLQRLTLLLNSQGHQAQTTEAPTPCS
jgi:anaerobic ribonucleoside-triphosphate reductase activating protein